jgi:spermidine synthase
VNQIVEPLAPGLSRVWELSEVLVDTRTPYQHLVIARTAQGVTLFCDNDRQSTEASQLVYHEALLVPALLLARRLDRILVIGSSEGVVSQLAVAAGARHVDHVDIDRDAVELCATHLPYGYTPADLTTEGPIHLHYTDGWTFVAETPHRYDIVVVDLPDEHPGPAQHNRLYHGEFLRRCRAILAEGGVLATQAGCPTLWRNHTLTQAWHRFHEVFGSVHYFGCAEHEWAFLFGTAEPSALRIERLAELPYQPATIDADTLRASTVAPFHVRTATARCPGGPCG